MVNINKHDWNNLKQFVSDLNEKAQQQNVAEIIAAASKVSKLILQIEERNKAVAASSTNDDVTSELSAMKSDEFAQIIDEINKESSQQTNTNKSTHAKLENVYFNKPV